MIDVRNLSLAVGSRMLLEGITLSVPAGRFVAIAGPNGVGKTTLLRSIAGMHAPVAGSIALDGRSVFALSARERARNLAFLAADETPVESLTVREVVAAARYAHHRWWDWRESEADAVAISTALSEVRMEAMRDRSFATLSSGERRNVWVALALAQETPLLLLDEPTTHLDMHVSQRMLGLLLRLTRDGKTILCALHDLNEAAAYADAIVLLGKGGLCIAGTPETVLSNPLLDDVYATTIERVRLRDGGLRVYPSGAPSAAER